MSEQMTGELLKRLDLLAAKLGVGAQHLWAAALRQQYIDGITSGLTAFLFVCGAVILLWAFAAYRRKHADCTCEHGLVHGLYSAGAAICAAISLMWLHDALSCLLNPELAAFKSLAAALLAK